MSHIVILLYIMCRLHSSLPKRFAEEFQSAFLRHVLLPALLLGSFNWIHLSLKLSPFLQFASHGSLESHGFARNRFWSIDTDPPAFPTNSSSKAYIDLILRPSEEDLKIWPHRLVVGSFITLLHIFMKIDIAEI